MSFLTRIISSTRIILLPTVTEYQTAERVRICKEAQKLLNNEGHFHISKIISGDETYLLFFRHSNPSKKYSMIF